MEMASGTSFAEATRYLDTSAESVRWEAFMEEIMEGVDGTDYDPNNACECTKIQTADACNCATRPALVIDAA